MIHYTGTCGALGCSEQVSGRVYKNVLLPINAPREYQTALGRMEILLCLHHYEWILTGEEPKAA